MEKAPVLGPRREWACFFIFSAVNAVLSYCAYPLSVKAVLFAAGLGVPFGFLLRTSGDDPAPPGKPAFQRELFARPSPWLWALLALLATGLRFFDLTTFRPWPSGDEALQGFFAADLLQKWDWRFFYTTGQHPPLLIWMLAPFFRYFRSPFFNLWFLPAVFSSAFVLAGYGAARKIFSRTFSFLFACLMAFGFWPLSFGRYCVQGALVPFFESVAFLLLAAFWESKPGGPKRLWAAGLGLWLGLGSLTYTSWFIVLPALALLVFWEGAVEGAKRLKGTPVPPSPRRQGAKQGPLFDADKTPGAISWGALNYFWIFSLSLLLSLLPWIIAAFRERFGGYALGVSLLSGFFNWKDQLLTALSYVTSLFWGPLRGPAGYGPVWGGLLNPVLSSAFILGLLEAARYRKEPLVRAVFFLFLVFLAPGLLSADHVEMFRVIQDMPILLLITAMGLARLLNGLRPGKAVAVLALLLGVSFCLDFHHLLKTGPESGISADGTRPAVRDENYWAYQRLKIVAQRMGPGWIFTDFILLAHNHTLAVATYPFNAAENPSLAGSGAAWAGVVANVHYSFFLARRFPGSQWFRVTPYPSEDGGMAVGIIPVTGRNRSVLEKWVEVHRYFHRLSVQAENMMNNPVRYRAELRKLPEGYGLVSGDPFLESCFGEWAAQYHYGSRYDRNIEAVQRALQKGYPAANLYYKLGGFYWLNRQVGKARWAYSMAARSKPDYTNAKDVLNYLDRLPGSRPVSAR